MILLKRYFKLFLKIDYTFLLSLCYNCVLFLFVFNDVKEHFFQASTEAANGNDVEAKEQSSRARSCDCVRCIRYYFIHFGFGGEETIHNVNKIFNNKILLYFLFQMNILIYKKI